MPFKISENASEKCNICEFNYNEEVDSKNTAKSVNEYEENLSESINYHQSDCILNFNEVFQQIRKPKLKSSMDRHLLIEIRNARERSRIFEINRAFFRLSQAVPYTVGRNKRISKVKTLQKALQYITELENQLYNGITDDSHSDTISNH